MGSYVRHPNSYLPCYNIQSETDGEVVTPLTGGKRILNGLDIGPHQIVESDEEQEDDDDESIQAYGFPAQQKRRNRRKLHDVDNVISNTGKKKFTFIVLFY